MENHLKTRYLEALLGTTLVLGAAGNIDSAYAKSRTPFRSDNLTVQILSPANPSSPLNPNYLHAYDKTNNSARGIPPAATSKVLSQKDKNELYLLIGFLTGAIVSTGFFCLIENLGTSKKN